MESCQRFRVSQIVGFSFPSASSSSAFPSCFSTDRLSGYCSGSADLGITVDQFRRFRRLRPKPSIISTVLICASKTSGGDVVYPVGFWVFRSGDAAGGTTRSSRRRSKYVSTKTKAFKIHPLLEQMKGYGWSAQLFAMAY